MNKKQFIFLAAFIFIFLILCNRVLAAANVTEETAQVNKGYTWLSDAVKGKWPVGTEDSAFSLLALAYDDALATEGKTALISDSKNGEGECWPSTCNVKETALAALALSRIGQNIDKPQEWLMAQNGTPSELNWYMQIDTSEEAICTVTYNQDGQNYNITLGADKKINKAAGFCLSLIYGNYWLKLPKECYEKEFAISCDKEFLATLFYQKPGETTIYISSDTKKESAGGEVKLKINSICLKTGTECDYEGTAWAALALMKNRDISVFIPYLVGYADENSKFMPETFLLMLTGQDDYANKLISSFKREGYWSTGTYSIYYDTALALLALQDKAPKQKDIAKSKLLKDQAKTGVDAGSWQSSKKDTAFVLYSVWPKEATYIVSEQLYCTDYSYFCIPNYNCNFEARLLDYYCPGSDVCCKEQYEEKLRTCNEMGGKICNVEDLCTGTSASATDGLCCMGDCEKPQINQCEEKGGTCRYSCEEGEKQNEYECSGARICCEPEIKQAAKSKLLLWIILIVLLAGLILFFFRSKLSKLKLPKFGRRGPPGAGIAKPSFRFPPTAPVARPQILGRQAPRVLTSNKELEETLRKLRERGG